MNRSKRIVLYLVIGFLAYFILAGDEEALAAVNDWVFPLIAVVIVLLLGLRFWRKDGKGKK